MTPAAHIDVHQDVLEDLLNGFDDADSLRPLFQALSENLASKAESNGFKLLGEFSYMGRVLRDDALCFEYRGTLVELGLGREVTVAWRLFAWSQPERFGGFALAALMAETGATWKTCSAEVLGQFHGLWRADLSAGWTPNHVQGLAAHYFAQWSCAGHERHSKAHAGLLEQLEHVLSP